MPDDHPDPPFDEPPFDDGAPPPFEPDGPGPEYEAVPPASMDDDRRGAASVPESASQSASASASASIPALTAARTPPHNVEAEQALLGAILLNNKALDRVSEFLKPEHFVGAGHREIYAACLKLVVGQNQLANPVTLKTFFESQGSLADVGGAQYLAELANAVVSIVNATDYGRLIHDLYLRRELIDLGEEVVNGAFDSDLDSPAMKQIEVAEQKLYGLATTSESEGGLENFRTAIVEAVRLAEVAHQREGQLAGVSSGLRDLDKKLGGLHDSDLLILAGRPSMGKAQPLDAKVRTPTGWTRMGDLKPGDAVASVDGRTSLVSGVFPQGRKRIYAVTFSDGRRTECCAEHLWRVHGRDWDAPRVMSTAEVAEKLSLQRYRGRLWIDHCSGDFGHDRPLPIEPWLLGALVGDGCLKGGSPRFSTASPELLDQVRLASGEVIEVVHQKNHDDRPIQADGHRRPGRQGVWPNPFKQALTELGLWGLGAEAKFVPDVYKTSGRARRLAVLRGLLDTDGWVERSGSVRFATVSERLADDVVDLARSLGAWATKNVKASWYSLGGTRIQGRPSFVCNIHYPEPAELFSVPEKKARAVRPRRRKNPVFQSIEPVREAEARCIAVTHPDRLYITDDHVVTHNTALATKIAFSAARIHNQTQGQEGAITAFFSLEMSAEQLATRILSEQAEVSSHRLRTGELANEDFAKVVHASQELYDIPLYIDDTPAITISALRTRCRRLARQHGLGLVVVDYLQLINGATGDRSENRVQEISNITRGLKAIAKELNVPVLALSQLSRAVEQRDDKRPQLSDLRESGSIEQDADVVMFVYREEYYLERAEPQQRPEEAAEKFHDRYENWKQRFESAHNVAEAIVAKQRHGPIGSVKLRFDGTYTKFEDLVLDEHLPDPGP